MQSSKTGQQRRKWDDIDVTSLIYPLFVKGGSKEKEEIVSMPGVYRFSLSALIREVVASCSRVAVWFFTSR